MSKYVFLCALLFLTAACKPADQEADQSSKQVSAPVVDEATFTFSAADLQPGCTSGSEMMCAINLTLKCTINPDFAECDPAAKTMPKFVFMRDESLNRPTTVTYHVNKLKPLADGIVEVYTTSTCDGKWFGLCNGNIIYVMEPRAGRWTVKEIYAMGI